MKILRILVAIVVCAFGFGICTAMASNLSQFEKLKEPTITTKKNQQMLEVEAMGDPNIIGAKAFGLLFQLYYTMQETPKGPMQAAPRARWPAFAHTPKSEWTGFYALPVPESITELPQYTAQEGLKATLTKWEYGEVAEILHIGPYDKEEPTVKRLIDFIKEQGYQIVGDHEEEYIKGPTMHGKGDPEKYLTIIRYQVKKEIP